MRGRAASTVAIAAILLTGCAGTGERAADDRIYAIPAVVDVTRLLSPPPEEVAQSRDLAEVRAAQQSRTAEQAAAAEAGARVDVFLFASVLGPAFTADKVPLTARFFSRVYRSAIPSLQLTKDCWSRPRPFVVDPTLAPLEKVLSGTRSPAAAEERRTLPRPVQLPAGSPCAVPSPAAAYSPSYPSGHATIGAMMSILLAEMVPERREALFTRGWEYGDARVLSGVHFPSDVEAGRILGTVLVGLLQQDARFRADLRAAREELRAALDYPR